MNAPYDVFWCLLCSGIIVLTEPERPNINYKYEECLADAVVTDVYALAQRVKKIDITRSVAFLYNGNIHYLERFFDINPDAINTPENREAFLAACSRAVRVFKAFFAANRRIPLRP